MKQSTAIKVAQLLAEQEQIGREMAFLRGRLEALEKRGVEISHSVAHLQVAGRRPLGQPRLKDAGIDRAWHMLKLATWQRTGVSGADLFAMLRQEMPALRTDTLRVYLHRLKNAGLIEKRGDLWHRVDAGQGAAALS